uniref:Amidase domain-containing protein n=1 Tax=Steinernema glaseri TaxID=37863 RepID=A0A1I7YL04_9BILA
MFTPGNMCYTFIWNIMSTPVVACPLGLNRDGVPIGCQIVGAPNSERLLISVAQELERKFGGWTPPGRF